MKSLTQLLVVSLVIASNACAGRTTTVGEAPTAVEDDGAEVFRTWDELPPDLRATTPRTLFETRMLVRLTVGIGCIPAGDRRCGDGESRLWGAEYDARCRTGSTFDHPLQTLSSATEISIAQGTELRMTGEDAADGIAITGGAVVCAPPASLLYDRHVFAIPRTSRPVTARACTYASDFCACGALP